MHPQVLNLERRGIPLSDEEARRDFIRAHATLVFLRHGASVANEGDRFGGWEDVGLTPTGEMQALEAGQQLRGLGVHFDIACTSVLKRAAASLAIFLGGMEHPSIPIIADWRLNERHYGQLQGMSKAEAIDIFGEQKVHSWRRGFHERPPPLEPGDQRDVFGKHPYLELRRDQVPVCESLEDTQTRARGCWSDHILPALAMGQNVLVVAHGNSIRSLLMDVENIDTSRISTVEVANAEPLVYQVRPETRATRHAPTF